ncbi:MAG TPA: type 4 pilus major pilin [Noviherbaspirillum sp.]|jgi:type II secretory pathway pseudopilin PulG|uniref:type 4 pilus major pilin n=1 Tax=Noviherbaspirillum sp. TaxID=1926288 RepID=UPI002F950D54
MNVINATTGVPCRAKFSRQRGASLLEGIAYLGIAAIVVLGAVSLLTGAMSSAKANQTTEELIALRTAVKKLYAGQTYPETGVAATVIAAKAVPSTLVVNSTASTITNAWGGAVTLAGPSGGGPTFSVVYNNMPQDVCVNALSGASGWTSIAQGSVSKNVFPLPPADASAVCNAATNSVTFTSN